MGTRGFVGWKVDGKITVSYNHFDSYPDGLGLGTLHGVQALLTETDESLHEDWPLDMRESSVMLILGAKFKAIRTITEKTRLSKADRQRLAPRSDPGVSTGTDNYSLLRNQQGDLRAMIADGVALAYGDEWPRDSLFCEWGYLVNFDPIEGGKPVLEVYKGFQTASEHLPREGEWAKLPPLMENVYGPWVHGQPREVIGRKRSGYLPVTRVASFPLATLRELDDIGFLSEADREEERETA